MTELSKSYDTNGFVLAKNIVSESRRNALLENIFKLFCKYSGNTKADFPGIKEPWNDQSFHTKMIDLRKKNSEAFGAIYDSLKTSITLTQLVADDKIVETVATFLKTSPGDISISEPMTRLDPPNDNRNKLDWHQERHFFPQNRNGMHGLVCWVPLVDVTPELGQIGVCPKSHQSGLLKLSGRKKLELHHSNSYT